MIFYTIGYGGFRSTDAKSEFVAVLKANGVKTLADVRQHPEKAHVGTWVQAKSPGKGINGWLPAEGIGYVWLKELGNEFMDDPDWSGKYRKYLDENGKSVMSGLFELEQPVCLFCAESDVNRCHRKIIADYLKEHYSCTVKHL